MGVAETIAGLDALEVRIHDALADVVGQGAHIFQRWAMLNAPVGDPDNSTNAPGDLKRSIDVEGPFPSGDSSFVARVGPTVTTAHRGPGGEVLNYGRLREFGTLDGPLMPRVSTFLVFTRFGQVYRKRTVFQKGAFYLTRAREEGAPELEAALETRLAEAVLGR